MQRIRVKFHRFDGDVSKAAKIRMLEKRTPFSVFPWYWIGLKAIRSFRQMQRMRQRAVSKRQSRRQIEEQTEVHLPLPLSDWIEQNLGQACRADVYESGFSALYVRLGNRWCGPEAGNQYCLQIARIEAVLPGHGYFTSLIRRISAEFPHLWLFVEGVMSERFAEGLQRMDFQLLPDNTYPPSYIRGPLR